MSRRRFNPLRVIKNAFWNAVIMGLGIGFSFLPLDGFQYYIGFVVWAFIVTTVINALREKFHF